MKVFVAGLNYKSAPVELREKVAVSPAKLHCAGCRLKVGAELGEVTVLSTCNRVEVYGTAKAIKGHAHSLFRHFSGSKEDFSPHVYLHEGAEAVRHLFSVVSGMDSMVVGETEITGQVKQAYEAAQKARLTGRVLNRLFQTALQTAKEVRTRTEIGRGAISVGSVAVELAEKIFDGDLSDKTIMIIGAGKMGEACIRHFAKRGARSVLVSNRSYERAEALAAEFGGRAIRFEELLKAMVESDIVVSSTGSPQTILHKNEVAGVMSARRSRPLFLIDIAVPRDIAPEVQTLENVFLYNIDHLQELMQENLRHRQNELARCRAIIEEKAEAVLAKLAPRSSGDQPISSQPSAEWALYGTAGCRS